MCTAILKGLRRQFIADGLMIPKDIGTVCCEEPDVSEDVKQEIWGQIQQTYYDSVDDGTNYDDITGELLDSQSVQEAIEEEMDTYKKHGVYRKVPIAESFEKTGKKPIKVRWVIVNKGDKENPEYRARLVAKEIKMDQRLDLFAATPPLEAKKFLFSLAVSMSTKSGRPYKACSLTSKEHIFMQNASEMFTLICHHKTCKRACVASLRKPCMAPEMLPKIGRGSMSLHFLNLDFDRAKVPLVFSIMLIKILELWFTEMTSLSWVKTLV